MDQAGNSIQSRSSIPQPPIADTAPSRFADPIPNAAPSPLTGHRPVSDAAPSPARTHEATVPETLGLHPNNTSNMDDASEITDGHPARMSAAENAQEVGGHPGHIAGIPPMDPSLFPTVRRVKVNCRSNNKKTRVPFDLKFDIAENLDRLDGKRYFDTQVNAKWSLAEEDGREIKDTEDLNVEQTYYLSPEVFQDPEGDDDSASINRDQHARASKNRDHPAEESLTSTTKEECWNNFTNMLDKWMKRNNGKFVEPDRSHEADEVQMSVARSLSSRRGHHRRGTHDEKQSAYLRSKRIPGFGNKKSTKNASSPRKTPAKRKSAKPDRYQDEQDGYETAAISSAAKKKRGRPPKKDKGLVKVAAPKKRQSSGLVKVKKIHKPTDHSNLPQIIEPGTFIVQLNKRYKRTVYLPKPRETIREIAKKFSLEDVDRIVSDNKYLLEFGDGEMDPADLCFDWTQESRLVLYVDEGI